MTDVVVGDARAALDARISELRRGEAYRNYERVRDWVIQTLDLAPVQTSRYWRDELESLEYLFDASPLVVERLRHHTYTVTGIRAYDYRAGKDEAARRFAQKLAALVDIGGRDMLVPESPLLGGFGHEIDGALYNIDTLKYYEILIALQKGGVLGAFRGDGSDRAVVCEIGPGWGGLAYVFKTLFPEVTYVLVDLPHLFLFSATYLQTAFPNARVAFWGDDEIDGADFVFVPSTATDALELPRLDLTLNTVSFQEMTGEQVARYAEKAYDLGSTYMYSLNRERSLYNTELESVSELLDRWFWLREVDVLPVNYMKMLDDPKKLKKAKKDRDPLDYKHLVGTRRVLA